MFEKYLNPNTRIYRFMSRAWDLIIVNILTLLTCLPIVTIGASLSAMHYVLIRLHRNEEGRISSNYFSAFRSNFRQGTIFWAIFGVSFLFLWGDWRLIGVYGKSLPAAVRYAVPAAALFLFMIMQYIFPLQARFENTIAGTFQNAFILSFSKLIRTVPMALIWFIPWLLLRHSLMAFPLLLMYGLSLPGYICTLLYDKVFKELEEKST